LGQRSRRASLYALAAAGATRGLAPAGIEFGDQACVDAAVRHLPYVSTLDVGTYPNTARAQDAAIVVKHVARVRQIDGQTREVVGEAHVGDAQRVRHVLQFAVTVRDANRADVVPLHQ